MAHPEGLCDSRPSTENDTKDYDDGMHDWYKAFMGDEKAFDRLSCLWTNHSNRIGKTHPQPPILVASIIESSYATSLLSVTCGAVRACDQTLSPRTHPFSRSKYQVLIRLPSAAR